MNIRYFVAPVMPSPPTSGAVCAVIATDAMRFTSALSGLRAQLVHLVDDVRDETDKGCTSIDSRVLAPG